MDTVLAELVRSYEARLPGPPGDEGDWTERAKDLATSMRRGSEAVAALRRLREEGPGADGDDPPRTHIIVAGQGSLFAPLRARLLKVLRDAGYIHAPLPVEDEPEPGRSAPVRRPSPGATSGGDWKARIAERVGGAARTLKDAVTPDAAGERPGGGPSPRIEAARREGKGLYVLLAEADLKDGCARGALAWLRAKPVMLTENHELGSLVIAAQGGGRRVPRGHREAQ